MIYGKLVHLGTPGMGDAALTIVHACARCVTGRAIGRGFFGIFWARPGLEGAWLFDWYIDKMAARLPLEDAINPILAELAGQKIDSTLEL